MTWPDLDIERNITAYLGGRQPTSRYTSFDYCFNYFQSFRETGKLSDLAHDDTLQASCMQLGFYLASWGMFRGSSELLRRSARTFVGTIEELADAPTDLWDTDADQYTEGTISAIMAFVASLRMRLPAGASDILVTKTLLGTMGCVPAFDTNFKRGFGVSSFGPKSLREIGSFYREHASLIDHYRELTLDFETGRPTHRRYSRAKVIDMIFFIEGMR